MTTTIAYLDESASGWQRALYAFLAEKERRSGSLRTVESYSRMLQHFFGRLGKTPAQATSPEVVAWACGIGLSGKEPGSITIGTLSNWLRDCGALTLRPARTSQQLERTGELGEGYGYDEWARYHEPTGLWVSEYRWHSPGTGE